MGSMLYTSSQPQHICAWERSEKQGPHGRVQQEQGDTSACPRLLQAAVLAPRQDKWCSCLALLLCTDQALPGVCTLYSAL